MWTLLGLVICSVAGESDVEVDTPRLTLAQLQDLFPEARELAHSDFLPGSFAEDAEHSSTEKSAEDAGNSAGPIESRMVTAATTAVETRLPRVIAAVEQRLPRAAGYIRRAVGKSRNVRSANPADYIKGPKPRMPLFKGPTPGAGFAPRPRPGLRGPLRARGARPTWGSALRNRMQRHMRVLQRKAANVENPAPPRPRAVPKTQAAPKSGARPYWSSQFGTSAERVRFFGKNLRDTVAKRDMKLANKMRQSKTGNSGQCSASQMQSFMGSFAFKTAGSAVTKATFKHATAKTTALFLITKGDKVGDHNGAFKGLNGSTTDKAAKSMCYRMMSMSSVHNVQMVRVESVEAATQVLKTLQADSSTGALKHVVLQGHGNPNVLGLGTNYLRTGNNAATTEFLQTLRPMLLREGEVRSTVLLESCSTGGKTTNGGSNLAQTIANNLEGAEVQAFQESVYPATYRLTGTYADDAVFKCSMRGTSGPCVTPITFIAKTAARAALLQLTDGSWPTGDDWHGFSDGVQQLLTVEDCAEWCTAYEQCASMKHEQLDEDVWDDEKDAEDADEVSAVGVCTLFSAQHVVEEDPRFGDDVSEQFGQTIEEDDDVIITEFDGLILD